MACGLWRVVKDCFSTSYNPRATSHLYQRGIPWLYERLEE
jgi:hypothetical protein